MSVTVSKIFQTGDIDFPCLENPGEDDRGCTAWFQLSAHEGSVLLQGEDVIPKDEWERHGASDGMFRLFFAPVSSSEAAVYLQVAPETPEDFRNNLETKKIPESFSGVVAIKMPGSTKIRLGPQENKEMKVGMGLIPFIVVNGPEGVEVTLPEQEGLRQELFNILRAVSVPRDIKSPKDYCEKMKAPVPPKAGIPKLHWPPYTVRQATNTAGECLSR